jgi:hypothetical protein
MFVELHGSSEIFSSGAMVNEKNDENEILGGTIRRSFDPDSDNGDGSIILQIYHQIKFYSV